MSEKKELLGDNARFDELMQRLNASSVGKSVSASEWGEVVEFIEENIMTDDRIMREYNSGRKVGFEEGTNVARQWLLNKASEAFQRGDRDEDAKHIRALGADLDKHMKSLKH